ncbi:MAG: methyl-accepting chemotaxis protein [Planctomycetota bacterium]
MSTWTIPSRITFGFLTLIAFNLLIGGLSLYQLFAIKQNVAMLADNSVPSVVALNEIIQLNTVTSKQVRQIIEQVEFDKAATVSDVVFKESQAKADELCKAYATLFSDKEDQRLFLEAAANRNQYLAAGRKVIELATTGKLTEAKAVMRNDMEPVLEKAVASFNDDISYNIRLASEEGVKAKANASLTSLLVTTALIVSSLLGGLIGWGIIRAVTSSLGLISSALQEGATQTSTASGQLAIASNSLAAGCSEQGSSVAETSAALEEMSVMIRSTADNAEKAKAFAQQARTAAQTGAQTMLEMNTAMHAIEASSAEVAKIVKNIDEIAFQTNILALNAAVEAARAGEAGAGFAVVADEVRSLAQRSAAAAKETAEKIETAIANSKRGSMSCSKVGESLEEIVQKVAAADGLVAEIATAAKEQSQGIQQVGVAMTQMDKVTQSNAASAQQSASAAEQLNSQAHSMQDSVRSLRALVSKVRESYSSLNQADHSRRPGSQSQQAFGAGGRLNTAPRLGLAQRSLSEQRRSTPQIAMPGDKAAGSDQDDKHFTNF